MDKTEMILLCAGLGVVSAKLGKHLVKDGDLEGAMMLTVIASTLTDMVKKLEEEIEKEEQK